MPKLPQDEKKRRKELEDIVLQYSDMMHRVARRFLPPQEVEECLAQVWVIVWEKLPILHSMERDQMAAWLAVACRNAALDRRRKLRRQQEHEAPLEAIPSDPTADPAAGPEESLFFQEDLTRFQKTVERLKPSDLELFRRKYYDGLSTDEIALQMDLTPRAVEGRLYRLRRKLKEKLTRPEEE